MDNTDIIKHNTMVSNYTSRKPCRLSFRRFSTSHCERGMQYVPFVNGR